MIPANDSAFGDSRHDSNLDEVLVAYLDGQLAAEQSEQIESQLSTDPLVRKRLQELDRVWNALDVLPRSTASPAFTRSTVEMAAVTAARPTPLADGAVPRWRLPAGVIAGLVGLMIGVTMTYTIAGMPQRRALRDLPVAMHASALENAGSIEFLGQLRDHAGRQLKPLLTEEASADARRWAEVESMEPSRRRAWLNDLPPEDLAEINTAVDRFEDRTAEKRASLRTLNEELAGDERADELREAAIVYHSIVSQLPQSEQASLRQMEPEERSKRLQRNAGRLAREAAFKLTADQRADFRAAVEALVSSGSFRAEAQELSERVPPLLRDKRREQLARRQPQLVLYATTRFVARSRRWEEIGKRLGGRGGADRLEHFKEEIGEPIIAAWSHWADQLTTSLPDPTKRALAEAAAQSEASRAQLFERLLREAAPEDLSDTFADLPERDVERLLLVPRERFVEELSQQDESEFSFDIPSSFERGFDRPPGPPGGERRGGRGPGRGGVGDRPPHQGPPPGPPRRGGGPAGFSAG